MPSKTRQITDKYQGPLFGSLAGIMIFLLFCILFLKCYKRSRFNVSKRPPEDYSFVRKVYLSHCAESKQEKRALSQFVGALKRFGIDVIVDVFSQVDINNAGGVSRWVHINMMKAEKIVVLLNEDYTLALQMGVVVEEHGYEVKESFRKVHWEVDYMNSLKNSGRPGVDNNSIFILSDKTVSEKVPFLKGRQLSKPKKFDIEDSDFMFLVHCLVE
jgi:hypothetical protein